MSMIESHGHHYKPNDAIKERRACRLGLGKNVSHMRFILAFNQALGDIWNKVFQICHNLGNQITWHNLAILSALIVVNSKGGSLGRN